MKNILIDIDGTVSDDIPNEKAHLFSTAKVLDGAVKAVNKLHANNIITFFTARREEHRKVTEDWLNINGFKYHQLLMNKPRGGNYIWIDNLDVEGIKYENDWNKVINTLDQSNTKNNIASSSDLDIDI